MNPMNDYEVEDNESPTPGIPGGLHLPIAIFALAFSVFLFSQISNLGQMARAMDWQSQNLDRRIASLKESEERFNELIAQRQELVNQSQQVQGRYTELLEDLMNLAETDEDARAVIGKYRIQRQDKQPDAP
jgi:Tfp pilus assembly protein PilN